MLYVSCIHNSAIVLSSDKKCSEKVRAKIVIPPKKCINCLYPLKSAVIPPKKCENCLYPLRVLRVLSETLETLKHQKVAEELRWCNASKNGVGRTEGTLVTLSLFSCSSQLKMLGFFLPTFFGTQILLG